jgi:hypothetical protein
MKLTKAIVVFSIVGLIAITSAVAANFAAQPAVTVAGVYENFTVGKGSGDLEGMRVVVVPAGGGYYAIVQIAQGGAEDPKPEFVPAEVKGRTASFTVGGEKYTATATAAGLTVKNSAGDAQMLKRKPCASYFK